MPIREPTEKQIFCVNIIVNQLHIYPPADFTRAAYSDFIAEYMEESKRMPHERRKHVELEVGDTSNLDEFIGQFRILKGEE